MVYRGGYLPGVSDRGSPNYGVSGRTSHSILSRGEFPRQTARFLTDALLQGAVVQEAAPEVQSALQAWLAASTNSQNIRGAYQALSEQHQQVVQGHLGNFLPQILSAGSIPTQRVFLSQLTNLAQRGEGAGQVGFTGLVLQSLSEADQFLGKNIPQNIRSRAQHELKILQGEGSFGDQMGRFLDHLGTEILSPSLLIGFGVGSLVSSGVRFGMLAHLSRSNLGRVLGGTGSSLLASTTALAAEVPAVYGATHLSEVAFSKRPLIPSSSAAAHEMKSLGLMLGLTRIGGGVFRGSFNLGHGIHPLTSRITRGASLTRYSLPLSNQLGMVSGLYAFNRIGPSLGLMPEGSENQAWANTFKTWIHMNLGALATNRILGSRYREALHQLETATLQTRRTWLGGPRINNPFAPDLITPEGFRISPEEIPMAPARDLVMMAEGKSDPAPALPGEPASGMPPRPTLRLIHGGLSTRKLQGFLRELYRKGKLAQTALDLEVDARPEQVREAQEVLTRLESEFLSYYERNNTEGASESRAERFRKWQKHLGGFKGFASFFHFMGELGLGIGDISSMAKVSNGQIRLRERVQKDEDLSNYYHDLGMVRDFLLSEGLHRYNRTDGRRMSHLLLNGEGHCVSLSILFAHLASLLGHRLQIGLLPGHLFLVGKGNAVIESASEFGILPLEAYKARTERPQPAYRSLGYHVLNLGQASFNRRSYLEAVEQIGLASRILPDAHRTSPLFDQMEGILRRKNDVDPTDVEVMRALEDLYTLRGRPDEAEMVKSLREFMELDLPDVE